MSSVNNCTLKRFFHLLRVQFIWFIIYLVYQQFNGDKSHFSSVPAQRPAVAGVLHAALAHGNAAVVGPRSPRQGGSSEAEVRERQHTGDTQPNKLLFMIIVVIIGTWRTSLLY